MAGVVGCRSRATHWQVDCKACFPQSYQCIFGATTRQARPCLTDLPVQTKVYLTQTNSNNVCLCITTNVAVCWTSANIKDFHLQANVTAKVTPYLVISLNCFQLLKRARQLSLFLCQLLSLEADNAVRSPQITFQHLAGLLVIQAAVAQSLQLVVLCLQAMLYVVVVTCAELCTNNDLRTASNAATGHRADLVATITT